MAGPVRRVAFLRSIEIQQAAPFLEPLGPAFAGHGVAGRLFYTHGDAGPADWPGEVERLPIDVGADELVLRLRDWGADGVISLSIPDENALRDAMVKEELAADGVRTVMHGVDTTGRLANKWATKELVRRHGLETPAGVLMDGDLLNGRCLPVPAYTESLTRTARELGFPLLSKPLWDCLGNGIRLIEGEADWARFLADPFDGNTVLERCLTGELCSVELIGRDGVYAVQPLIWKGPTGANPGFAFSQVRYSAPRAVPDRDFEPISERLVELCAALQVEGAIEVEMIYSEGTYSIIEINPRVSGSTGLSIAASGYNTYLGLLDLLLDDRSASPGAAERARRLTARSRLAFQIPLLRLGPQLFDPDLEGLTVVRAGDFTVDGTTYTNMLMTCEYTGTTAAASALGELALRHGLLDVSVYTDLVDLLDRAADQAQPPTSDRSDRELCAP